MIAAYSGYRFDKPFTDYGVDAVLEEIEQIRSDERTRYIASGKTIDVQLKSTTSSKILESEDVIKFDLEVKTYNDLVRRYEYRDRRLGYLIPLLLIVFVLPEDSSNWIDFTKIDFTKIKGNAYWIYPSEKWQISKNRSSIRIEIPLKNRVDLKFCDKVFNLLYENQN